MKILIEIIFNTFLFVETPRKFITALITEIIYSYVQRSGVASLTMYSCYANISVFMDCKKHWISKEMNNDKALKFT
jgi:hypothetical protein